MTGWRVVSVPLLPGFAEAVEEAAEAYERELSALGPVERALVERLAEREARAFLFRVAAS